MSPIISTQLAVAFLGCLLINDAWGWLDLGQMPPELESVHQMTDGFKKALDARKSAAETTLDPASVEAIEKAVLFGLPRILTSLQIYTGPQTERIYKPTGCRTPNSLKPLEIHHRQWVPVGIHHRQGPPMLDDVFVTVSFPRRVMIEGSDNGIWVKGLLLGQSVRNLEPVLAANMRRFIAADSKAAQKYLEIQLSRGLDNIGTGFSDFYIGRQWGYCPQAR